MEELKGCDFSSSRVDVEQGIVRPWLGPQELDLLESVKEDIAMNQVVVVLDFPSSKELEIIYSRVTYIERMFWKLRKNVWWILLYNQRLGRLVLE